eukprot:SAG31_NODE_10588_length_1121_cov_0.860078_2_plen_208_part_00
MLRHGPAAGFHVRVHVPGYKPSHCHNKHSAAQHPFSAPRALEWPAHLPELRACGSTGGASLKRRGREGTTGGTSARLAGVIGTKLTATGRAAGGGCFARGSAAAPHLLCALRVRERGARRRRQGGLQQRVRSSGRRRLSMPGGAAQMRVQLYGCGGELWALGILHENASVWTFRTPPVRKGRTAQRESDTELRTGTAGGLAAVLIKV